MKRFVAERRRQTHERDPRPWERFAYHVLALRRRIEVLAGELNLPDGGRVLEFGCANQPYRHLFAARSGLEYVGADLPGNPLADLTLTEDGRVPAPDASFDAGFEIERFEGIVGMLPAGLQMIQDDRLHDDVDRARDAQTFALVAWKP